MNVLERLQEQTNSKYFEHDFLTSDSAFDEFLSTLTHNEKLVFHIDHMFQYLQDGGLLAWRLSGHYEAVEEIKWFLEQVGTESTKELIAIIDDITEEFPELDDVFDTEEYLASDCLTKIDWDFFDLRHELYEDIEAYVQNMKVH